MPNIVIRKATLEDLPKLTAIYNQAIQARQTADTLPLTVADRQAWFDSHQELNYPLFAVEKAGVVCGYSTLSKYRGGRHALRYVVEVSYYLDHTYQRQGIGTRLLKHALEMVEALGFKYALAILLDTNAPSIGLLEKFGFVKWGHMPDIGEIDGKACGHLYYGKHLFQ